MLWVVSTLKTFLAVMLKNVLAGSIPSSLARLILSPFSLPQSTGIYKR